MIGSRCIHKSVNAVYADNIPAAPEPSSPSSLSAAASASPTCVIREAETGWENRSDASSAAAVIRFNILTVPYYKHPFPGHDAQFCVNDSAFLPFLTVFVRESYFAFVMVVLVLAPK